MFNRCKPEGSGNFRSLLHVWECGFWGKGQETSLDSVICGHDIIISADIS
jgi:hypothetical protein